MIAASARDFRHAVRGLLARPMYALVSIATLMLIVGAGTAVLAVINATRVRPLPFPDGQRLVRLFTQPPGTTEVRQRNPLHPLEFVRFRRELRTAAAVEGFWARERALGGDGESECVSGAQASAGAFALLGGVPVHGRTWTEDEDRAGARLVVLGHGLWQRRFGGDPAVIGRTCCSTASPTTSSA